MTKPVPSPDLLTPQQATDLMTWVISETRSMMAKMLEENFKLQHIEFFLQTALHRSLPAGRKEYFLPRESVQIASPDFEKSSLKGYCGHAQVFIKSALEDIGYAPTCYAIQSLGLGQKTETCHVGLTIDLQTTEGTKRYLLDPTFSQFCTGAKDSPGALLANLPDGEHMIKTLLDKGFVEFTPTAAASYLTAFCKGICPFGSNAAIANFFSHPTDERSLRPVEKLWPPKSFFVKKGWTPGPAP
jgi:hypothetical protein